MTKKKIITIISIMIMVVLLFGVVGIIAYLTNNFTTKINDFQVEVNEVIYKGDNSTNLELSSNTEVKFKCKKLLNFGNSVSFEARVIPNANAPNFDFYVDEQVYSFAAETEYTTCFNLTMQDDGFTILIESGNSIAEILQKKYDGKKITLNSSVDTFSTSYFMLVIVSDKATVNIPLLFHSEIKVTEIELIGELLI